MKERTSVFSESVYCAKAGFKSPTALKHVIDGKRNLSLEAANRFATALKMGHKEALFSDTCSVQPDSFSG